MSEILNTNENISDLALAYFDEVDEVLKEITPDNLYFSISPYSSQYKRLYLIGDLIYKDIIKVSAYIDNDFYEVYVKVLDSFNKISDFEESTNYAYCTLTNKHLNSIPVDFLIVSNNICMDTIQLTIELSTGDYTESPSQWEPR